MCQIKKNATIQQCDCDFPLDPVFKKMAPERLQKNFNYREKIDEAVQVDCGYLIVPESRQQKKSNLIKLPFILVKSSNPNKKGDPVFYTGGGPGASSLQWAVGITKSTLINDRDILILEQRGTQYALPNLRNFELDKALKTAYRINLNRDSMALVGIKKYKQHLMDRGIDLSGYNTAESVQDIHDLFDLLEIESVNLYGISYSGGLMQAVAKQQPSRIHSMVLDSPLPTYVAIDEDEPRNFIEALEILFERVEKDSILKETYPNLENRFHKYFNDIINTQFQHPYLESDHSDTTLITYDKNDLLHIILQYMFTPKPVEHAPKVIDDIINGEHTRYITKHLESIFQSNQAPHGMRISVYCADQYAYNDLRRLHQLYQLYPYLDGFHINNVYASICDQWGVPPVKHEIKAPYYADIPVLAADGSFDPACRPLYLKMIGHNFPNTQAFLFKERSHGVGGKPFYEMVQKFIDDPFKNIVVDDPTIIPY